MSIDYNAAAVEARDSLAGAGGADPGVNLTHTPKGEYDRATGKPAAAGAPVVTLGVGLVFDYGLQRSGEGSLGGSLIEAGDRQLYLAALTMAGAQIPRPVKGDKAIAPDGLEYNVEFVKTLAPAGIAVMYELQLRR